MVPRVGEYDTTREPAPRLKPIDRTSTRRAGGQSMFQLDQEQIDRPKVLLGNFWPEKFCWMILFVSAE